ncbi:MAG: ATP-dependent DNA helicase [Proteobacteria bacterium]|nr:ATP-dependent DNA helicase [Pseudomonadota bacterium]
MRALKPDASAPAGAVAGAPVLLAGFGRALWLSPEGEVEELSPAAAGARLGAGAVPLLCHGAAAARRLGCRRFPALDLLELFAFARPAAFCVPTPRGLADALGLGPPGDGVAAALSLRAGAAALLAELAGAAAAGEAAARRAAAIARVMAAGGWPWGPAVLAALGAEPAPAPGGAAVAPVEVWRRLPEWAEHAPPPSAGHLAVEPAEARARLAALLGAEAEARPQQADYASAVAAAFAPRERAGDPIFVLAEAGTGVGKTLGYIAPASLWAEKNGGPVWLSTFTRNLQRQLDSELDRLFPERDEKARKVVIRKGRENYLCLLNFEEAVRALPARPNEAVAVGLMARWAEATRDGDMVGGDFPAWLADLLGRGRTVELADRRGECVYSACPHYHKCFIERAVRRARRAEIVVANHALVMAQAAQGGLDDSFLPTRYVFDEGHHVFAAADSAFAAELSGEEGAELRRWLLGPEESRARSRARGLRRRLEDLVALRPEAGAALAEALAAARALPAPGWRGRLAEGAGQGPAERFLALVRQQVLARAKESEIGFSLETEALPPVAGLGDAAAGLAEALVRLKRPLARLSAALARLLDEEAGSLDGPARLRIEATCRGLKRRALDVIDAWRGMLAGLGPEPDEEFVDWFAVERVDGREADVGMHRRWVDPTLPFAGAIARTAHGILVTSATLRDASGDVEADWAAAARRTGAVHLPSPPIRAQVPSPFDYPRQTRVLIVTDVRKDDAAQVAAAYRELILAARGGALGLFTAIHRLRAVHARLAPALEEAGIMLLAQHVDPLDTATLVDIFRAEENASLLGTDAVRDGVDVPGRSLRLIVFDRVPWPRADILHRARRARFGGAAYDDMITRLRLKQAFGRLVRRADDRGVFVLLDRMMPSRLFGAFPEGVTPARVGLAEAAAATAAFLAEEGGA